MRILHINVNYLTSALHQTMIEHMNELGIENKVFAPTYNSNNAAIVPNEYVTVSECFRKCDRFFYHHKQSKIIKATCNSNDISSFDIIHAYTLFTDGNVAMQLSKSFGVPYVVAVRNTDLNVFFRYMVHLRSLGVDILRNASQVFFLSNSYREIVIKKFIPKELQLEILSKSRVIPNGIDDFWHENKKSKPSEGLNSQFCDRVIKPIYVGVIDKNKNIELTIKALKRMAQDGWNPMLTVVGRIVDKRVYDHLIRSGIVKYIRPQDRKELITLYRDADVFIMPSHKESFGLVYAEAMSQGLPVIYSKGQGFDQQFEDGFVGYSVDSKDASELYEKLKLVVKNYGTISSNCLGVVDKFNWKRITEEYKSIYENVLT